MHGPELDLGINTFSSTIHFLSTNGGGGFSIKSPQNAHAVLMIMEAGGTGANWKGVRVYLKMTDCQTSGKNLEEVKSEVAKRL